MGLSRPVRAFWYGNKPGTFSVSGYGVTRGEIQTYGGPSPDFEGCIVCQWTEWLSRVRQENLSEPHRCPTAEEARRLCAFQGDELWTLHHQDFRFSLGCDAALDAPKCALVLEDEPAADLARRFASRNCDHWMINLRRQLAQACQVEVVDPAGADWSRYDFAFAQNTGHGFGFARPPLPLVLYGHDCWGHDYQGVIDRAQPDIFLTPYPTAWRENYRFPPRTKIRFYFQSASRFFTRPNLGEKELDLLVIGATGHPLYEGRHELDRQITPLASGYRIEFSHRRGHLRNRHAGPTEYREDGGTVRYLNKWSEYLGLARYVAFGPMGYPLVLMKYYECLGSGAVPIVPEVGDLRLLGVEPFVHYVPLSEIWARSDRLRRLLDHYADHRHIAERAARWHEETADRRLFGGFEDVMREATEFRYPRRLVR